jgi:hypothetical protein
MERVFRDQKGSLPRSLTCFDDFSVCQDRRLPRIQNSHPSARISHLPRTDLLRQRKPKLTTFSTHSPLAVPYRQAFVPLHPVPIIPPIVAPGPGSKGKNSGWEREARCELISSQGTPDCTTMSESSTVGGWSWGARRHREVQADVKRRGRGEVE